MLADFHSCLRTSLGSRVLTRSAGFAVACAAVSAMTIASAGLAAQPGAARPQQPAQQPVEMPAKDNAEERRAVVAATDWIAADALRLLAGKDVDVVVVPGLTLGTPARRLDLTTPQPTSPGPAAPGPTRTGERPRSTSELTLSDEARAAVDAAEGLVSTDESRDLHIATRDLCPAHAALVTAIRPQLRVERADGSVEPAFWVDAGLWARTVLIARQTLAKVAPEHDQAFRTRAQSTRNALMALNDEMMLSYSQLPKDAVLIVGAEGLGQIARVHEREVRVVPSSLKTEEDQANMAELVDLIVTRKIPVAFPIDGVRNANLDELAKRVKARGGDLRIAQALHVDTPIAGDDGSAGAVERMIRHNARVVRDGFTTKALPTAP